MIRKWVKLLQSYYVSLEKATWEKDEIRNLRHQKTSRITEDGSSVMQELDFETEKEIDNTRSRNWWY